MLEFQSLEFGRTNIVMRMKKWKQTARRRFSVASGRGTRLLSFISTSARNVTWGAATHAEKCKAEIAAHHVVQNRVDGSTAVIEEAHRVVCKNLPARYCVAGVYRFLIHWKYIVCLVRSGWTDRWRGWIDFVPVACQKALHMERRPADQESHTYAHCIEKYVSPYYARIIKKLEKFIYE